MKPIATFLFVILSLAASAQVDSVPQVTNPPKWFATGIVLHEHFIPSTKGFDLTTNAYDVTVTDQTNLLGNHRAIVSYAGKQDVYQGLTNGGWEGPDMTPPTGLRISFCGSTKFFCATNPTGNEFFRYDHASGYGITPINDSTDLVNWQLYAFDPSTNPPPLKVKTEVVSLGWPVN